jgi:hypothetical protein
MRIRTAIAAACVLSCMTTVSLAQTSVDRSFKATSRDCGGVQWSEEALRTYPTIASACQGVEQRNGKTYVKFSGTVQRNANRGKQVTVNFKDGGMITLTPPAETRLYVNGKRKAVSELQRGDALNFYIAEDRLAAQFPESDAPTAQYVIVPIATGDQPDSSNEQLAATLPSTASPLPLLALCGFLSMGLGAALTILRKR